MERGGREKEKSEKKKWREEGRTQNNGNEECSITNNQIRINLDAWMDV